MEILFHCGLSPFNKDMRERMENDKTKVNVTLGYTLNLGNFQSLRVDIGVEDALRSEEHVEEAFTRVYSFVENKLIEKINEAKTEVGE
jgi:hypothetical protein